MYGSPLAPPAAPPPAFAPPIAQLPPPPPPSQPVPGPNAVANAKRDQRRKDNAKAGSVVRALAPAAKPPPAASVPAPQADAQAPAPNAGPSPVPDPLPAYGTLINQNAQGNTALASLGRIVMGIESSGGANPAPSPSGAVGPMQVKPATAAQYGFDPRRVATDPAYNVKAGMFILGDLLQRSGGDPIKAAIGYNAGPGAMGTPLPGLSSETRNYVARVASALDAQRAAMAPQRAPVAAKPPPAKAKAPAKPNAPSAPWKDPNSAAEAPPQEAAPPPAASEATPTFKPAEYHAPAKGLEYLAAGLSILFPGTGIARLASSFGAALGKRADDRYARDEGAAEKQYGADKDAAQIAFENANAQRQSQIEANAVKFANEKIKWDAAQSLRQRGIDPVTQKPFVLPPALRTPLPPTAGYDATYKREMDIAAYYRNLGATDAAAEHEQIAATAAADFKAQQVQAAEWQRELLRLQNQNVNEQLNRAAEDARSNARIEAEETIHDDTIRHEDALDAEHELDKKADRDLKFDVDMGRFKSDYATAVSNFEKTYRTLIAQPTYKRDPAGNILNDGNGNPIVLKPSPLSNPDTRKNLQGWFRFIQGSKDPVGTATFINDHILTGDDDTTSALREVLDLKAETVSKGMLAGGQAPAVRLPQSYYDGLAKQLGLGNKPKPAASDELVTAGKAKIAAGGDPAAVAQRLSELEKIPLEEARKRLGLGGGESPQDSANLPAFGNLDNK